jgi:GMP synthase-like glutamine amidotransferase
MTPTPTDPLRLLILQPVADDGPAQLATWLATHGLAARVVDVAAGDAVPTDAAAWDAIAMLGGPMSVNDDLPWLRDAEALLRDAVARGVPVLGHCLGGQMLARALGAPNTDNPVPEIGWVAIDTVDTPLARAWFGDAARVAPTVHVYQWHFQTFALPAGATRLAGNARCANQAYAIGPHLGMQFHIEVDAEKLDRWCAEAAPAGSPLLAHASVQDEPTMRADTARWLAQSQVVAGRIYTRWIALARARRLSPSAPPSHPSHAA